MRHYETEKDDLELYANCAAGLSFSAARYSAPRSFGGWLSKHKVKILCKRPKYNTILGSKHFCTMRPVLDARFYSVDLEKGTFHTGPGATLSKSYTLSTCARNRLVLNRNSCWTSRGTEARRCLGYVASVRKRKKPNANCGESVCNHLQVNRECQTKHASQNS